MFQSSAIVLKHPCPIRTQRAGLGPTLGLKMQSKNQDEKKDLKRGWLMRGRKPKQESRATELRRILIEWKQAPASSRPSLRSFACELGTSHQLLAFSLKGLDEWQGQLY